MVTFAIVKKFRKVFPITLNAYLLNRKLKKKIKVKKKMKKTAKMKAKTKMKQKIKYIVILLYN